MKTVILAVMAMALAAPLALTSLSADGCYICRGQSGTYVKFTGSDTFDKRKAAKNCGCEVGGTTGSCSAANYKILCTVYRDQKGIARRICLK